MGAELTRSLSPGFSDMGTGPYDLGSPFTAPLMCHPRGLAGRELWAPPQNGTAFEDRALEDTKLKRGHEGGP